MKITKQPNGTFLAEEGQFVNDEWVSCKGPACGSRGRTAGQLMSCCTRAEAAVHVSLSSCCHIARSRPLCKRAAAPSLLCPWLSPLAQVGDVMACTVEQARTAAAEADTAAQMARVFEVSRHAWGRFRQERLKALCAAGR